MSDFVLAAGMDGLEVAGDLVVVPGTNDGPGSYQETDGLETAIRLSLFTNARALPGDELPEGEGAFGEDLGGWWGDAFLETGSSLGSRLWLLRRAKLTAETRQRARDYALEALQWLIDDRIASDVEVETFIPSRGCLELEVLISREGETPTRFQYLWEGF